MKIEVLNVKTKTRFEICNVLGRQICSGHSRDKTVSLRVLGVSECRETGIGRQVTSTGETVLYSR